MYQTSWAWESSFFSNSLVPQFIARSVTFILPRVVWRYQIWDLLDQIYIQDDDKGNRKYCILWLWLPVGKCLNDVISMVIKVHSGPVNVLFQQKWLFWENVSIEVMCRNSLSASSYTAWLYTCFACLLNAYVVHMLHGQFFSFKDSFVCSNMDLSLGKKDCLLAMMQMVIWGTQMKGILSNLSLFSSSSACLFKFKIRKWECRWMREADYLHWIFLKGRWTLYNCVM